jgi:hypothetical protein
VALSVGLMVCELWALRILTRTLMPTLGLKKIQMPTRSFQAQAAAPQPKMPRPTEIELDHAPMSRS